ASSEISSCGAFSPYTTPGTRPARRSARLAPLPTPSRACAVRLISSAISLPRYSWVSRLHSVEQARHRTLVADAPDRFAHQRRDRDLADLVGHPDGLGRPDAVGDHEGLELARGDAGDRAGRQHT